jgi:hypothetical protein
VRPLQAHDGLAELFHLGGVEAAHAGGQGRLPGLQQPLRQERPQPFRGADRDVGLGAGPQRSGIRQW